jgi:hypothetical protein
MEEQLRTLLDDLVRTQFAELSGSWANLHLEIPEKMLNEVVNNLLVAQRKDVPLLRLVSEAQVKGSLTLDVKLSV